MKIYLSDAEWYPVTEYTEINDGVDAEVEVTPEEFNMVVSAFANFHSIQKFLKAKEVELYARKDQHDAISGVYTS